MHREKDPLKIIVRFPDENRLRFAAFVFIHALFQEYPQAHYYFISSRRDIGILSLLPLSPAFIYGLEDNQCGSVVEMYRFARITYPLKNADMYFCLTTHSSDRLFGLWAQIKKKIGFKGDKLTSLLLDHSTFWLENCHPSYNYLNILSSLTSQTYYHFPDVLSREFEPLFALNSPPYGVINIPIDDNKEFNQSAWADFLKLFAPSRIFITADGLEDEVCVERLNVFKKTYGLEHVAVVGCHAFLSFARLLQYADFFFSYDSYLIDLASYMGTRTWGIYSLNLVQEKAPSFFAGRVNLIDKCNVQEDDLGSLFDQYFVRLSMLQYRATEKR